MNYYNQGFSNFQSQQPPSVTQYPSQDDPVWRRFDGKEHDEAQGDFIVERLRQRQLEVKAERELLRQQQQQQLSFQQQQQQQQQQDQLNMKCESPVSSSTSGSVSGLPNGSNSSYGLAGISDLTAGDMHNQVFLGVNDGGDGMDEGDEEVMMKRKAQNRAAQKAFRERRELRVKALEQRGVQLEEERAALIKQIDELKQENAVLKSENEVLKTMATRTDHAAGAAGHDSAAPSKVSFPSTAFFKTLTGGHDSANEGSELQITNLRYEKNKEVMLGVGAVWEKLTQDSTVTDNDIQYVLDYLKGRAVCDGFGPVYPMSEVNKAVVEAKANRMG